MGLTLLSVAKDGQEGWGELNRWERVFFFFFWIVSLKKKKKNGWIHCQEIFFCEYFGTWLLLTFLSSPQGAELIVVLSYTFQLLLIWKKQPCPAMFQGEEQTVCASTPKIASDEQSSLPLQFKCSDIKSKNCDHFADPLRFHVVPSLKRVRHIYLQFATCSLTLQFKQMMWVTDRCKVVHCREKRVFVSFEIWFSD